MNVVVVGGGAAGMMAAIEAAKCSNKVVIVEKTSTLGNKIKITGKGRCNLTFDGDIDDFKKNVVNNFRFMYSSFSSFDNKDVVKFFNDLGLETKVERGARIFPVSDNAKDVVKVLESQIKKYNIKVIYNACVCKIIKDENNKVQSVVLNDNTKIDCDKCILATGGTTYKTTGSTGDGYRLAKEQGHNIVPINPGLVSLNSQEEICKRLQGLSLRNIGFKLVDDLNNEIIYEDFGELLFAHFGLTGPVVLSSSSKLNRIENVNKKLKSGQIYAVIDLKPALDEEKLDRRVCRDFEKYANKEFKNSLFDLLPKNMVDVIVDKSLIDGNKKVNQITKEERKRLVTILKKFRIRIDSLGNMETAIITCGGVDVKEINPKTMESKLVKGLYFAGEIIDVDAYTGGYNLQIAFSTGFAAGNN